MATRQELLAEAQRRGLTPQFDRDALLAEAQRRGIAQPQADQPAITPEQPQQQVDIPPITGGRGIGGQRATQQRAIESRFESANIPEIGDAPELNEFTQEAFKASLGLLLSGDPKSAQGVLQEQFPGAQFRQDEGGNTIIDLPSGSFAINKPGVSGQDIIRTAFAGAAFTPAGRATSLLGGAAAAGATEAGLQVGAAGLGGEASPEDIALSTALGPIAPIARGVGQAARQFATGAIPQAAQETIEAGAKAGIPVLTTDVIPPKGIVGALAQKTGELIPIAGTGAIRGAQQEAREQAAVGFANQFPTATADDIFQSLKVGADRLKQAAGKRISDTTTRVDELGEISAGNALNAVDEAISNLSKKGRLKDTATIDTLNTIKQALTDPQTFSLLRDNRTAVRELAESSDPLIRSQLPSFSKTQLQKVRRAITDDLDEAVLRSDGTEGLARYKRADQVYAQEAKKLTKSRLKNALDKGDVTPEAVENVLFSKKASEVNILHKSLTAEGKASARSALINRAVEKAGGIDDLSPTKFANELKRLKTNTGIFFKGANGKVLDGLEKVLSSTKRAAEAAAAPPTGQVTVPLITGTAAFANPVAALVGTGTVGLLARAYESKAVRNALLRVNNAPTGTALEAAIDNASTVIGSFVQAQKELD